MTNLNYLETFFKKHHLDGKVTIRYTSPIPGDEYMSDIIFENGDTININDVILDIESDFPEDMVELWMKEKKTNDISFFDWLQKDTHYVPKDMDTSSVNEFQKEMTTLIDDVKKNIDTVFNLGKDIGDSDLDMENDEGEDE